MSISIFKGDSSESIDYVFNPIKGMCLYGCGYCHMKGISQYKTPYLSGYEFRTNLGKNSTILVCSAIDLLASNHPDDWIERIIRYCEKFPTNKYVLETVNPERLKDFKFSDQWIFSVTIESNRVNSDFMGTAPTPQERAKHMLKGQVVNLNPLMDFDLPELLELVKSCEPRIVNIGSDTRENNLPEPSNEKVQELIKGLESFTKFYLKGSLVRILAT